ncbi:MAG: hypothetical protein ACOYEK_02405 [bacterium]|jgi:hypothetical protein
MPEKDSLTEMALFTLEQQGLDGQREVAQRLSALESAVRSLGKNGFAGSDDYDFYL